MAILVFWPAAVEEAPVADERERRKAGLAVEAVYEAAVGER